MLVNASQWSLRRRKTTTEDEVVVCSIGRFLRCEYFHHNSTMLHGQCDVTEHGLGKRCAQLPVGPSANWLQPDVRGSKSGFLSPYWASLDSLPQCCFTPECSSQEGPCTQPVPGSLCQVTVLEPCVPAAFPWVREADGDAHVPRNVGSARRERSSAAFLEKTCDTKMALDEHFWL